MQNIKKGLALLLLLALSFGLISCGLIKKEPEVVYRINKVTERRHLEDGTYIDTVFTLEYDDYGNPVKYEVVSGDEYDINIMEYNEDGLLIREESSYKYSSGRQEDGEARYYYDEKGKIIKFEYSAGSQTREYKYSASDNSYERVMRDENGRLSSVIRYDEKGRCIEYLSFGEGVLQQQYQYHYDSKGNQTAKINRSKDGSLYSVEQFAYVYGDNGELLQKRCWYFRYNDWKNSVEEYQEEYQYSYDENGNLIKMEYINPEQPDYNEFKKVEENLTYDEEGNLLRRQQCYWHCLDGTTGKAENEYVWEYDEQGNPVKEKYFSSDYETKRLFVEREYSYEAIALVKDELQTSRIIDFPDTHYQTYIWKNYYDRALEIMFSDHRPALMWNVSWD